MAQYKGAASEGSRAMQMMKKREKAQEEVEFRKKKIEEELKLSGIKDKFASHYDAVEQQLKVGSTSCVVECCKKIIYSIIFRLQQLA